VFNCLGLFAIYQVTNKFRHTQEGWQTRAVFAKPGFMGFGARQTQVWRNEAYKAQYNEKQTRS